MAGGEPFTRKDIPEICKSFYSNNKLESVYVMSNGQIQKRILPDVTRLLQECPDLNVTVALGIDGLGPQHDKIRQKPGSWEIAIDTARKLQELKKEYPKLDIQTCLLSATQLEKLRKEAKHLCKAHDVYGAGLTQLCNFTKKKGLFTHEIKAPRREIEQVIRAEIDKSLNELEDNLTSDPDCQKLIPGLPNLLREMLAEESAKRPTRTEAYQRYRDLLQEASLT